MKYKLSNAIEVDVVTLEHVYRTTLRPSTLLIEYARTTSRCSSLDERRATLLDIFLLAFFGDSEVVRLVSEDLH